MFEHIGQIKTREAYEKTWLLSIASQGNRDEAGQKKAYAEAEKIGRIGNRRRKRSAFEVAGQHDPAARVRMIGSAWASAGERWAKGHAKDVQWLQSQGITLDEAAAMFEAWWDERVRDANGEFESGTGGVAVGIGGDGKSAQAKAGPADQIDLSAIDIDADIPDSARGEE